MAAEGLFEAFYAGEVQHPILLWLSALAAFAWCAAQRDLTSSVMRYCAALTALSLADAWLTAHHVYGLGALPGWASGAVPLFFVLAGDFRYLLLIEAATPGGGIVLERRHFARAAVLTAIVPVSSQVVVWLLPEEASAPRVLFLVYELAFVGLVAALLARHPGVRAMPWLRSVSRFVILYYALWATADAIILATGSDLGFGLRVLPNLLYYGGLIAVIGGAASRARSRARR